MLTLLRVKKKLLLLTLVSTSVIYLFIFADYFTKFMNALDCLICSEKDLNHTVNRREDVGFNISKTKFEIIYHYLLKMNNVIALVLLTISHVQLYDYKMGRFYQNI